MRVKVYATLRPIVGGREVELDLAAGSTVRELVDHMVARWPELESKMIDEGGGVSRLVHVLVDGRSARHLPAGTDTALEADCEVDVFPAVAGG